MLPAGVLATVVEESGGADGAEARGGAAVEAHLRQAPDATAGCWAARSKRGVTPVLDELDRLVGAVRVGMDGQTAVRRGVEAERTASADGGSQPDAGQAYLFGLCSEISSGNAGVDVAAAVWLGLAGIAASRSWVEHLVVYPPCRGRP